jgi:hypothetical protein
MQMQILLLAGAVVLGLLQAASLFSSKEFWRGSGRVGGGLSTILLALLLLTSSAPPLVNLLSVVLALTGLVTVGSGLRKFVRRNSIA